MARFTDDGIRIQRGGATSTNVATILAELPAWFGIEEYTRDYAAAADRLPGYTAVGGKAADAIGVALLTRHFEESAEIHLMAVRPAWHRRSLGRRLLETIEADLREEGVRVLSVKTLGPSRSDAGYDATRLFYESMGFVPVEEFMELWPENPCLLMVKCLGSVLP